MTEITSNGWNTVSLGAIAQVNMGVALPRDEQGGGMQRYIQVRHLLPDGRIAPWAELAEAPARASADARTSTEVGDIVLACRGASLRSGLVEEEHVGAFVANNLIRIRILDHVKMRPEVFLFWFRSPQVQSPLLASVMGAIGIHLRARDVDAFRVPVLPEALQLQLVELYHEENRAYSSAIAAAEHRRTLIYGKAEAHIFGEKP